MYIYGKQRIFYENVNFSPSTAYYNGPVKNTTPPLPTRKPSFLRNLIFPEGSRGPEIPPILLEKRGGEEEGENILRALDERSCATNRFVGNRKEEVCRRYDICTKIK